MIKLTSEQRVWALRWAADYLEQHGEQDTALESLRHCADMTEKYCLPTTTHGATKYVGPLELHRRELKRQAVRDEFDSIGKDI